jgi:RimJ/RimL family protein N-acetyltransferase
MRPGGSASICAVKSPVPVPVPVLETERTIMRGFCDADLDAAAAWMSDPEVMRFIGGVQTRSAAWRSLATYLGHWQLRGYGLWGIERKADGQLIGRAGLWNPEGWPGIEVGWTFARHAWGQGYATECGAASIAWAWENLPALERIISVIDPANQPSRRVAERLGMQVLGPYKLLGEIDVLLYGRARTSAT